MLHMFCRRKRFAMLAFCGVPLPTTEDSRDSSGTPTGRRTGGTLSSGRQSQRPVSAKHSGSDGPPPLRWDQATTPRSCRRSGPSIPRGQGRISTAETCSHSTPGTFRARATASCAPRGTAGRGSLRTPTLFSSSTGHLAAPTANAEIVAGLIQTPASATGVFASTNPVGFALYTGPGAATHCQLYTCDGTGAGVFHSLGAAGDASTRFRLEVPGRERFRRQHRACWFTATAT